MEKEVERVQLQVQDMNSSGNKDPVYRAILAKNLKLKDKIEEVANYIYKYDEMYFFFSDKGKETWIERHYPEVKNKRKLIIRKINRFFNRDFEPMKK